LKKSIDMENCIYGPVPSRRLGRSLGIDLFPAKICSYDCVYCQLGRTAATTVKRRPFRSAVDVLTQLKKVLADGVTADCLTIAGSGEPTLNSEIGTVIRGMKETTPLPVAVLTNGSLLSDASVRDALMAADIVVPSLDAYNAVLFEKINRPHKTIGFDRMVQGLVDFSRVFSGRLWLEIFIMDGINAAPDDAAGFKPLVDKVAPTDVYINTAVRPPADSSVKQVSEETIDFFYRALGVSRHRDTVFSLRTDDPAGDIQTAILEMAARRPVTIEDMAAGLAMPIEKIRRAVEDLAGDNRLDTIKRNASNYFRVPVTPRGDHQRPPAHDAKP
jgi:wyosine [tRNA(Phe)-imidazoG37] synthetase (radical SAM superfamily)